MIEGFKIYTEGPNKFFVTVPEDFSAKNAIRVNQGYVLDFERDPETKYTFLDRNEEGLTFYFDGKSIRSDLVLKIPVLTIPEMDNPAEEWSLDFCETDPWLCERAFELYCESEWGGVVAMGLMGRHKPLTEEQRAAFHDFTKTGVLILPESRERNWFRGLSEEAKRWIKQNLGHYKVDLAGDILEYLESPGASRVQLEWIALQRDNIQSVLWLMEDSGVDVAYLDELARNFHVESDNHQLSRAGTDYPEMWWVAAMGEEDVTVS